LVAISPSCLTQIGHSMCPNRSFYQDPQLW
jgi:hypothetical protein